MTQTRREFLGAMALAGPALASSLTSTPALAKSSESSPPGFLFGADVYPELQTPQATRNMLDLLERAHMNVVRVGESSWGNLEVAPGQFNFSWLRQFLDELERRGIKAILGTSTYLPPQWLAAAHPETLQVLEPGSGPSDPMARHCPCLNHPLYRDACGRYIAALAQEFHGHPAVIAWQLDNEIESMVPRVCYNAACDRAWRQWLEKTYRTPQEFNERLDLVSWGMKIGSFREVPQVRAGVEESDPKSLAALWLANLHFRHDLVLDFLAEQAAILRRNGVQQWVITDWNTIWTALADDPKAQEFMSIAGLNYYQSSGDNPTAWRENPWHLDMHRSCYGKNAFLVTETRFGVTGGTSMGDPVPSQEQFRMWGLELAAFGALGMLYWSGNRWRGGHWPHWGGLLDWSGHAEQDFDWAVELGRFFQSSGPELLANPVASSAVVLTDFDQRAALEVYPHIRSSPSVFNETFSALHRLGIGTDTMNCRSAEKMENLRKYSMALLPAATAFDDQATVSALHEYVAAGGTLLVTPFTAYMDWDGVFRGDGFAANLAPLTGALVRTVRWMGSPTNGEKRQQQVLWSESLMNGLSPVGLDGYVEYLEVAPGVEVIARFKSDQTILDGRPAATIRKVGKGSAIKLAFWPQDDSFLTLLKTFLWRGDEKLAEPAPPGVLAVPRTDSSLFVINATSQEQRVALRGTLRDRISRREIEPKYTLKAYEVLWLE